MIHGMLKTLISTLLFSLLAALPALALDGVECADVKGKGKAHAWYTVARDEADNGLLTLAHASLQRTLRSANITQERELVLATLNCLLEVHSARKDFSLPAFDRELSLLSGDVVLRYAFESMLERSSSKNPKSEILMAILKKSPSHHGAIRGLQESVAGNDRSAVHALSPVIANLAQAPREVKAQEAMLRLALARSLYALSDRTGAVAQYEKLFRIGAPVQDALIESAWAHLAEDNDAKALGLSHELQTGKMASFFAPEAASIQAIALLENCRYAESKKSIERFSVEYAPIVDWLKSASNLYENAIARAEGVAGNEIVPDRVWSLWATSPIFTTLQEGIRASFAEEREARETRKLTATELARFSQNRQQAAERIEKHLKQINQSMLARLAKETERLRFVRIEANQGASRDLVYLNAHPEVRRLEASLKGKSVKRKGTLRWGKAKLHDPKAELWIDEIGAFEAKSLNRCDLKKLASR